MEQASEKVFVATTVVQLLALGFLVVFCVRRRRGAWALAGGVGGVLCLLVEAAYLASAGLAEVTGDFRLLRALAMPWGDIARDTGFTAGMVLLVAAVTLGHPRD